MKIVMPVDDKSIESNICQSFGRTPYFLIYDTETEESIYVDNSAIATQGGAGIKAAQLIVDQKAKGLITPRCGEKAAAVIKAANIEMYKAMDGSALDNIKAFKDNKLSDLEDIHPGFHNHGGQ